MEERRCQTRIEFVIVCNFNADWNLVFVVAECL